jgi:uncharacterized protein with HEPN domain
MRDPQHRITDMLKAIASIQEHVGDDQNKFQTDPVMQGFVAYQLMILGEAAYRMPSEIVLRHPEIPWRRMSGMRHVLVHGYFYRLRYRLGCCGA